MDKSNNSGEVPVLKASHRMTWQGALSLTFPEKQKAEFQSRICVESCEESPGKQEKLVIPFYRHLSRVSLDFIGLVWFATVGLAPTFIKISYQIVSGRQ